MSYTNNISDKRNILSTIKIRFSPEVQPIKETAIDKIVEQTLYIMNCDEGKKLDEIQDIFTFKNLGYTIPPNEIKKSISRLINKGIIIKLVGAISSKYKLVARYYLEIDEQRKFANKQINSIVNRLFNKYTDNTSLYTNPFLKFLSILFSLDWASFSVKYSSPVTLKTPSTP